MLLLGSLQAEDDNDQRSPADRLRAMVRRPPADGSTSTGLDR
jgi:hypothetical protein